MIPNEKDLLDNLGKIAYTLDKAYISRLNSDYGVWYFDVLYLIRVIYEQLRLIVGFLTKKKSLEIVSKMF